MELPSCLLSSEGRQYLIPWRYYFSSPKIVFVYKSNGDDHFSYSKNPIYLMGNFACSIRELQIPQGFSPEPVTGGAACIIENMRGMPIIFGGLALDPDGNVDPHVAGGCEDKACTSGKVYLFDKPAHGWESIQINSSPYPRGRAGHTMTGEQHRGFMQQYAGYRSYHLMAVPFLVQAHTQWPWYAVGSCQL